MLANFVLNTVEFHFHAILPYISFSKAKCIHKGQAQGSQKFIQS